MISGLPHTLNGLHWLQGPLEASLARVRATVERHLESGERAPLLDATEELRQVRGTLAMIQCAGGELLAREILALLQALAQVRVSSSEEAFAALSGATLQLSDYLELLCLGQRDHALVLQPLINELRLARGRPLRTEAELFAAQIQALPIILSPPSPATA
ncbi:MAG: hypothetical protein KGJ55_03920, partial [Gammaproteobacteria bacterium]|nr:hypothetical protein [Gammaproteobacteria bacterium]